LLAAVPIQAVERAIKMVQELISGEPGSAQAIIQKVRCAPAVDASAHVFFGRLDEVPFGRCAPCTSSLHHAHAQVLSICGIS
jgi:hypothetical protein